MITLVADPGIGQIGRDDVVVPVDRVVGKVDVALVGTQQDFTPILVAIFLEVRIQRIDFDVGAVARTELDRCGRAKALTVVVHQAVARDTRVEGIAHFDTADIGRAGGAVDAVDRTEGGIVGPADRVVAEFGRFVFRPCSRCRKSEGLVGIVPCEQAGDARRNVVVQVVVATLHGGNDLRPCTICQRVAGVEVDDRTKRTFIERCRRRFVDDDRIEQLGCEDVEVECTIAVERCTVDRGRDRFHAVDADTRELGAEAADSDLPTFACIAFNRDTGNALERFREVGVREFCDVFSDDDVDLANRFALRCDSSVQRFAEAGNDDDVFIVFAHAIFSDGAGCIRILRHGDCGHEHDAACEQRRLETGNSKYL